MSVENNMANILTNIIVQVLGLKEQNNGTSYDEKLFKFIQNNAQLLNFIDSPHLMLLWCAIVLNDDTNENENENANTNKLQINQQNIVMACDHQSLSKHTNLQNGTYIIKNSPIALTYVFYSMLHFM